MVADMDFEYSYTVATEEDLNDLLSGHESGVGFSWPSHHTSRDLIPGSTGVVWKRGAHSRDPIHPLILVSREEEVRRLCGRFAQVRRDFSPLTSWCHLLTSKRFESLKSPIREPDLHDLEAAWSGLIIAEAQLLAERAVANLRFPSCLATLTFAISRASAIWSDSEIEITRRFNAANGLFRGNGSAQGGEIRTSKIRFALQPIWASLIAMSRGGISPSELRPIVDSLNELQAARQSNDREEAARFAAPLRQYVPEAHGFFNFLDLTPEQRLKTFDQLMDRLKVLDESESSLERNAVALLAGYLSTVAAGGSPTLSLAQTNSARWPEITGWAYVTGGIGERIVWTSSFDGLGRLVARELTRTLRLDEPPLCDIALDEGLVLVDPKLSDPLVHLRMKQATLATVALLPGVNVLVPTTETSVQATRPQASQPARETSMARTSRDPFVSLADALWPYLRSRVEDFIRTKGDDAPRVEGPRSKNRAQSNTKLPLRDTKK
jgi:hypothetical protein